MGRPDILYVDGRAFSWRRLCELRRRQMEAWAKAEASQPALFELKIDCRPRAERSADGRYRQPSLLEGMAGEATRKRCTGHAAFAPCNKFLQHKKSLKSVDWVY
jgi:hypothetical protein